MALDLARRFLAGSLKEPPSWACLAKLSPEQWSHEDPSDSLETLFLKASKKSPEGFSPHAQAILSNLHSSIHCDGLITGGFAVLVIRMLRSADIGVRNSGVSITNSLFAHLELAESISQFVSVLVDSLKGKTPGSSVVSVPQNDQKLAILLAISSLNKVNHKVAFVPQVAIDGLFHFILKEDDLGLSVFCGRLTGELLSTPTGCWHATDVLGSTLVSTFLSARPNARKAVLVLLGSLLRVRADFALPPLLVDQILQLLSGNKGKLDGDGVIAFSLLMISADQDVKLRDKIAKGMLSSVLETLLSTEMLREAPSVFCLVRSFDKFRVSEDSLQSVGSAVIAQEHTAGSIQVLLRFLKASGKTMEASGGHVAAHLDVLLKLLLHAYRLSLSDWMKKIMSVVAAEHGMLGLSMLRSLLRIASAVGESNDENALNWLAHRASTHDISMKKSITLPENAHALHASFVAVLSGLFGSGALLHTVAAHHVDHYACCLALAALCHCHPIVSTSPKASAWAWKRVVIKNLPPVVLNASMGKQIATVLFEDGVMSPSSWTRAAAHRALALLTRLDGDQNRFESTLLGVFASFVSHGMREAAEQTLNSAALRILVDADSVIESEFERRKAELGTNSSATVSNAERKKAAPRSVRKGNFGADTDLEEWTDRVRQDREQKAKEILSTAEFALRTDISNMVKDQQSTFLQLLSQGRYLLESLSAFEMLESRQAFQCLEVLAEGDAFFKLLASPLLGEYAQDALGNALTHAIKTGFFAYVRDLAAALRLAARHVFAVPLDGDGVSATLGEDVLSSQAELPAPVLRLFRALNGMTAQPGAHGEVKVVFLFSYRVLQCVCLLKKTDLNSIEMAFSLLQRLWPKNFSSSSVVYSGVDLCLQLLALYPKAHWDTEGLLQFAVNQALPLEPAMYTALIDTRGLLNREEKVRLVSATLVKRLTAQHSIHRDPAFLLEISMWMILFDESTAVKAVAADYWQSHQSFDFDQQESLMVPAFHAWLRDTNDYLRRMAGSALAGYLSKVSRPMHFDRLLEAIIQKYCDAIPKKSDASNPRPRQEPTDTTFVVRLSYANTFLSLGTLRLLGGDDVHIDALSRILTFLMDFGVVDPAQEVRNSMLSAAVAVISSYGVAHCEFLLGHFEGILVLKPASGESVTDFDLRYAAAVVLLGTTARHLNSAHPSFRRILQLLVDSLQIPSESVQRAVSDCLTPIAQLLKGTDTIDALVKDLLHKVLQASTYGERRGSAFGLSALVKGVGIPSLKTYNVMGLMKEACTVGSVSNRQGAMFAIECLAERLGLLFEPYVIGIIDALLDNFSHSSDHVRDAAQGAVKVIMTKLSAHGVKQILAPVVNTLNHESAWKTRVEAIKMLGTMANCAPKQLSSCLPQIVPCLMQAGTDPHPKVKDSAKAAMTSISSVIRNPEINKLSATLLAALGDPSGKTKEALDALLQCEFMYTIDAPSLALLVPILSRALRDRSGDLKRKAAAITGNMMTMVGELGALKPYMSTLLPGLKDCLIDPIPDVRASGSKALGSLYQGIGTGDNEVQELLAWLHAMLKSEASPVERSGAAQGLAEICGSCTDSAQVAAMIESVLNCSMIGVTSPAREGMMWYLSFLPYSLKERLAAHINISLRVILLGLSDDAENVREVAIRAGKVVVSVLGISNATRIAPPLLEGISSDDWRIRLSSLQLLGDLLYLVGETKSTGVELAESEEDLSAGAGAVLPKLKESLGLELTQAALATIYIARADTIISVRQFALQIWKAAVSNTPKTLVEIMPTLVDMLVSKLSSPDGELRLIAGRSIGELVSKLGERVLSVIVPPLERGLDADDSSARLGVCLGLGEVLSACTKKQAEEYLGAIITAVSKALCDDSFPVCEQAAKVFMILYRSVGPSAIDLIVPSLLHKCEQSNNLGDQALKGLRQIVIQRPRDMLEYLLPKFLVENMSCNAVRALTSIVDVAGAYLHYYLDKIFPILIQEMQKAEAESAGVGQDTYRFECLRGAATAVVSAITTIGVLPFVSEVGKLLDGDAPAKRRQWGCWLVGQFFKTCKADFVECLPVLLKYVLSRVADMEQHVLLALRDCMSELAGNVPLEYVAEQVDFIRNCILSTASAARHKTGGSVMLSASGEFVLPLFTVPKALDPFFAVFSNGLANGGAHVKEHSADMIAECADMAAVDVLKPTLLKVVGSLIRTIGDRFPSAVKSAILRALIVLMKQGGAALKAFAPQLQTTFVKALNDPMREVRQRGRKALWHILRLGARVDPLLSDLTNLCMQVDSNAIRLSVVDAIGTVLQDSGTKIGEAVLDKAADTLQMVLSEGDDMVVMAVSRCLGLLGQHLSQVQLSEVLLDLMGKSGGGLPDDASLLALVCTLHGAGPRGDEFRTEIYDLLVTASKAESSATKSAVASGLVVLVSLPKADNEEGLSEAKTIAQSAVHKFSSVLADLTSASLPSDVRIQALLAVKQACKSVYGATSQHLGILFPPVVAATKDIDLRVKFAAESAAKSLIEGKGGANGSAAFQQFLTRSEDAELVRAVRECQRRIALVAAEKGGDAEDSLLAIFGVA